jgi:Mg-chelatase subunit ChlD
MRRTRWLLLLLGALVVAAMPALGQSSGSYTLKSEKPTLTDIGGRHRVDVKFQVLKNGEPVKTVDGDFEIEVYEQGKLVTKVLLPRTPVKKQELSVVLAVDISGSMSEGEGDQRRMDQAKAAAKVFFSKLPADAEAGLILFDDQIRRVEPMSKDRDKLLQAVEQAEPLGGTAYLDACLKALAMLKNVPSDRERVIVVMTDGMDLHSKAKLKDVIQAAQQAKVKIFTVGIGKPGQPQNVTSVLVLDRSGSMMLKAKADAEMSKLEALRVAAKEFVRLLPEADEEFKHKVRTTILQFSDAVDVSIPTFISSKARLDGTIDGLKAAGETALFDATYDAIAALEAENPKGKKVVVALTDGIDNVSRRRPEEVIERAKKAKIPVYMLGFGQKNELDAKVMTDIARATGGEFYQASDTRDLMKIFENLSVKIHDEGVNEEQLTRLANATGGRYYPAEKVHELELVLEKVIDYLRDPPRSVSYITRTSGIGVNFDVRLKLVEYAANMSGGRGRRIDRGEDSVILKREGLLLAQMSPVMYFGFLLVFGLLIGVPLGVSRMTRPATTK